MEVYTPAGGGAGAGVEGGGTCALAVLMVVTWSDVVLERSESKVQRPSIQQRPDLSSLCSEHC